MNKPISIVTNRQINLTYIIAGCLSQAFDDMQEYLRRSASELNHENKHIILEMIKLCSRYNHFYERLRKVSVVNLSDKNMFYHNDAIDKYYSLFILLITRIGSDDDSDLRSYAIMKKLSQFVQRLNFPKEDFIHQVAWQNIEKTESLSEDNLYKLLTSLENEVGQE